MSKKKEELKKWDLKHIIPKFKSPADEIASFKEAIDRHIEKRKELEYTIELQKEVIDSYQSFADNARKELRNFKKSYGYLLN